MVYYYNLVYGVCKYDFGSLWVIKKANWESTCTDYILCIFHVAHLYQICVVNNISIVIIDWPYYRYGDSDRFNPILWD